MFGRQYSHMVITASMTLFGVPCGIRVVKLYSRLLSTSTKILCVVGKKSFISITRGFIPVKEEKHFKMSSSSYWLGTSLVEVGHSCWLKMEPPETTIGYPMEWNMMKSTSDSLTTRVIGWKSSIGIGTISRDLEGVHLSKFDFPFLNGGSIISWRVSNSFFCCLSWKPIRRLTTMFSFSFSSSITIWVGRLMTSLACTRGFLINHYLSSNTFSLSWIRFKIQGMTESAFLAPPLMSVQMGLSPLSICKLSNLIKL